MHFVCQGDATVSVNAELILRVDQNKTVGSRDLTSPRKNCQAEFRQFIPDFLRQQALLNDF